MVYFSFAMNISQFNPASYYHVYNKAVNGNLLFKNKDDYTSFLSRIETYISKDMEIFVYALLPNHFHLLIKTPEDDLNDIELSYHNNLSRKFSNCFNSYSKWYNLKYDRKGSLFMRPFKRKLLSTNEDISAIIYYIHRNPVHHGLTKFLDEWAYSSYIDTIKNKRSIAQTNELINWFGDLKNFTKEHESMLLDWQSRATTWQVLEPVRLLPSKQKNLISKKDSNYSKEKRTFALRIFIII